MPFSGRDFLSRVAKDLPSESKLGTEGWDVHNFGHGLVRAWCTGIHPLILAVIPAVLQEALVPRQPKCVSAGLESAMEVRSSAPRRFSRALVPFPRVFAAEVVAADSDAADSKVLVKDQRLPSYIPEPRYQESGWERLRELFVKE